jgi:predicted patatin/cPLA2 family phospholipase
MQGAGTYRDPPVPEAGSSPGQGVGLVLQGGGLRGAYSSGVVDAFLDEGVDFPYVIGVSAGANTGGNYVAGQRERNHKMFVELVADPRYSGIANFLRERSWFGMRFLFETAPDMLVPLDYEAFHRSPRTLVVVATDCTTGLPAYFRHHDYDPRWFVRTVHRASSSLPLLSPPVTINGRRYLDGGVSDPIPIDHSITDGNSRNVVVLTVNAGHRRSPKLLDFPMSLALGRCPGVRRALRQRGMVYNACLDRLAALEQSGRVFILHPLQPLVVGRMERDVVKLDALYHQGYEETLESLPALRAWMASSAD